MHKTSFTKFESNLRTVGQLLIAKIKPGSFKDEISIDAEGNWVIRIKEKPIDGAANAYLIKFLAKEFNLGKSEIIIEKGLSSRFKKIRLELDPSSFEKLRTKYKR